MSTFEKLSLTLEMPVWKSALFCHFPSFHMPSLIFGLYKLMKDTPDTITQYMQYRQKNVPERAETTPTQ